MLTQRPELFGAVISEVPLLDMLRYTLLPAGASWIAEYGDPAIPEEAAYLAKYSPYQNVRPDATYPPALFLTSTADDRVHPGHARKMAAKMQSQGHGALFYEETEGGHGGGGDLRRQAAYTRANICSCSASWKAPSRSRWRPPRKLATPGWRRRETAFTATCATRRDGKPPPGTAVRRRNGDGEHRARAASARWTAKFEPEIRPPGARWQEWGRVGYMPSRGGPPPSPPSPPPPFPYGPCSTIRRPTH